MVMALAFITYGYGGGEFRDQVVSLQVVNVSFAHVEVLTIIVSLVYVWMIYRYWLTHRAAFTKRFREELDECKDWKAVHDYVKDEAPRQVDPELGEIDVVSGRGVSYGYVLASDKGLVIRRLHQHRWQLQVQLFLVSPLRWTVDGELDMDKCIPEKGNALPLRGWRGAALSAEILITCLFARKSFSDYMVPYLLVLISLGGLVL